MMNITARDKQPFIGNTFAYKVEGKLPADVTAKTVTVKIGSKMFETTVGEDKTFKVAKLVAEDVTEAIVEVENGSEILSEKVTF